MQAWMLSWPRWPRFVGVGSKEKSLGPTSKGGNFGCSFDCVYIVQQRRYISYSQKISLSGAIELLPVV